MRAVWSFWSKPFVAERHSTWYREWHHWLAWGLSLHTASLHYPDTLLVTDDEGARILIDELQLPFAKVSTALNVLKNEDPGWWALGKIATYRLQDVPFVHLDTDVFLWHRLSRKLERADVIAQNPEPIVRGASCYRPEELMAILNYPSMGWLPEEWVYYVQLADFQRAECCGIFGGSHLDFIHHYADLAMRLIQHPANRRSLQKMDGKPGHMILVEQYLLTACLEFHRSRKQSSFSDVSIRYIFPTTEDAYDPDRATEAGYTHLAAGAKRHSRVCRDLERRVQYELPNYYDRCLEIATVTQTA